MGSVGKETYQRFLTCTTWYVVPFTDLGSIGRLGFVCFFGVWGGGGGVEPEFGLLPIDLINVSLTR